MTALVAVALWGAAAVAAQAGAILDRVRTDNTVRCGAKERPGLAQATETGVGGLAVDLCRAAAIATLGPAARIEFRLLDGEPDFDMVRNGAFDILFLTPGTLAEEKLAARIVPGPPVYIDRFALMVPENSAAHRPEDLNGKTVCFMIASPAQRALEAAFDTSGKLFSRLGFEEDVEMRDAYNVGRCEAVADAATTLAVVRQDGGVNHLRSRILDQTLALDPVFAATGTQDGTWSATVAWLMHGLIAASTAPSAWHGSATALDEAAARDLGLRDHWEGEVAGQLGTYADMVRRHTGEGSSLHLAPGLNAPWPAGLLLTPTVP